MTGEQLGHTHHTQVLKYSFNCFLLKEKNQESISSISQNDLYYPMITIMNLIFNINIYHWILKLSFVFLLVFKQEKEVNQGPKVTFCNGCRCLFLKSLVPPLFNCITLSRSFKNHFLLLNCFPFTERKRGWSGSACFLWVFFFFSMH